jgi:transposase-like protein
VAYSHAVIMNCAMHIERRPTLRFESHQRTPDRQDYVDGFKPTVLRNRVGKVGPRIPQTRTATTMTGARTDRRLKATVGRYYKTGPEIAECLKANISEAFTPFAFPAAHRRRLRTDDGLARLTKKITRRPRVTTLLPRERSLLGRLHTDQ